MNAAEHGKFGKSEHFIIIRWNQIGGLIRSGHLSEGEGLLYGMLCGFALNDEGSCHSSNGWLGTQFHKADDQIRRRLKKLVSLGLIEVDVDSTKKNWFERRTIKVIHGMDSAFLRQLASGVCGSESPSEKAGATPAKRRGTLNGISKSKNKQKDSSAQPAGQSAQGFGVVKGIHIPEELQSVTKAFLFKVRANFPKPIKGDLPETWPKVFLNFTTKHSIPLQDFEKVLRYHTETLDGKFYVRAITAKTVCKRYDEINAAMAHSAKFKANSVSLKAEDVSPIAKAIYEGLKNKPWPEKAKSSLLFSIERSFRYAEANAAAIKARLPEWEAAGVKRREWEKEKFGSVTGSGSPALAALGRLESLKQEQKSPLSPRQRVEVWYNALQKQIHNFAGFGGFTPGSKFEMHTQNEECEKLFAFTCARKRNGPRDLKYDLRTAPAKHPTE